MEGVSADGALQSGVGLKVPVGARGIEVGAEFVEPICGGWEVACGAWVAGWVSSAGSVEGRLGTAGWGVLAALQEASSHTARKLKHDKR
jgi:hypothetical protein